jgi:hypothetical protein
MEGGCAEGGRKNPLCREKEVDRMIRRIPMYLMFSLAVGIVVAGTPARAQAQSFVGKWVHEGPRGVSIMEFFPGDSRIIGPTKGRFHHSVILDDGRVIAGDGTYVYRSILPNRGWLILHFADGHVTREHEHTADSRYLRIEHHGVVRTYVRQ